MFAVNVDYSTEMAMVHVWPDGQPLNGRCQRRDKKAKNGAWYVFERYADVRKRVSSDSLRLQIRYCSSCDSQRVAGREG